MDLKETPRRAFLRHPWELARYRFFRSVLADAGLDRKPLRLLDVGSGDGWFASQLVESLPAGSSGVCWDEGYATGAPLLADGLSASSTRPQERYDLVLMLDVAEHVADDEAFVGETVEQCMHDESWLVFSVPAWQELYTDHDSMLGHHRRYRPQQARRLLTSSGLQIVGGGGLFHSLLLPRGLQKVSDLLFRSRAESEEPSLQWKGGQPLQKLVTAALAVDGRVSKAAASLAIELPGLSWWALARRR